MPALIEIVQALAVFLLMFSAGACIYTRAFVRSGFTLFEGVLYFMSIMSIVTDVFSGDRYILVYTCAFTLVCASVSIICRSMSLADLLDAGSIAFVGMVVTLGTTQYSDLVAALTVSGDLKWLNRFTPLDLHPDLVGVIFGGGCILLGVQAILTPIPGRVIYALASVVSLMFVFAASARSSLIALGACVGAVGLFYLPKLKRRALFGLASALVPVLILLAVNANATWSYVSNMLELESTTRGLDSGGTGRTDLWIEGVNLIASRSWELIIGSGLRSSGAEKIGFSTENSYVTITLESGLYLSALFLFSVVRSIVVSCRRLSRDDTAAKARRLCVIMILSFMVTESFFNRYLIAIGNPLSLLMLILNVSVGVEQVRPRLRARSRQTLDLAADGGRRMQAGHPVVGHRLNDGV